MSGCSPFANTCLNRPSKSHKKKHKKRQRVTDGADGTEEAPRASFELVKLKGSGRLLSSGTTLMGQVGTKFLQELRVGDAVIVQHPKTLVEETRIVRMVLSDVSAAVSSAFSSDLVSSTPFHYIKAPPEEQDRAEEQVRGVGNHVDIKVSTLTVVVVW